MTILALWLAGLALEVWGRRFYGPEPRGAHLPNQEDAG